MTIWTRVIESQKLPRDNGESIFAARHQDVSQGSLGFREINGPHPQYGWDFPEEIPEKFRKDPGNALRAFPGIPVESTAGIPQAL